MTNGLSGWILHFIWQTARTPEDTCRKSRAVETRFTRGSAPACGKRPESVPFAVLSIAEHKAALAADNTQIGCCVQKAVISSFILPVSSFNWLISSFDRVISSFALRNMTNDEIRTPNDETEPSNDETGTLKLTLWRSHLSILPPRRSSRLYGFLFSLYKSS
jgi:hypothetical protein